MDIVGCVVDAEMGEEEKKKVDGGAARRAVFFLSARTLTAKTRSQSLVLRRMVGG